jgi:hypothetical protein
MPVDRSELSSISKTLEELARRVARMGEEAHARQDEGPATELFAVERALSGATRRLGRLIEERRR